MQNVQEILQCLRQKRAAFVVTSSTIIKRIHSISICRPLQCRALARAAESVRPDPHIPSKFNFLTITF